jgi:hypothetical protein
MDKRKKFIITSLALSLGFVLINFLDQQYRFLIIGGLAAATILLFSWSLFEGLGFNTTLLTLILPTLFTLGIGLFWFLLPTTLLARLPVVILYGLGIYTLCLTTNIYTVSAIRNIALMRAAKGVGFVLTLLTSFLLFDAILSLKANFIITTLSVFSICFLLFVQGLWASSLKKTLDLRFFLMPAVFSLGMLEISALLYFWPVTVVVGSLFLAVGIYILLGLGQASLEGRFFRQTVRDYLTVGLAVFSSMFLFATHWGG